jgi:hypothetical protein
MSHASALACLWTAQRAPDRLDLFVYIRCVPPREGYRGPDNNHRGSVPSSFQGCRSIPGRCFRSCVLGNAIMSSLAIDEPLNRRSRPVDLAMASQHRVRPGFSVYDTRRRQKVTGTSISAICSPQRPTICKPLTQITCEHGFKAGWISWWSRRTSPLKAISSGAHAWGISWTEWWLRSAMRGKGSRGERGMLVHPGKVFTNSML